MVRPTKPIDVTTGTYTKEQVRQRKEQEAFLRGCADNITPSEYLNEEQRRYFEEVVEHYRASGILSNVDVAIIEQYAISRYALKEITDKMNQRDAFTNDSNKELMIQREKWEKSFHRASNELGLSPQSRAKLGNINADKQAKQTDPLLKALKRA